MNYDTFSITYLYLPFRTKVEFSKSCKKYDQIHQKFMFISEYEYYSLFNKDNIKDLKSLKLWFEKYKNKIKFINQEMIQKFIASFGKLYFQNLINNNKHQELKELIDSGYNTTEANVSYAFDIASEKGYPQIIKVLFDNIPDKVNECYDHQDDIYTGINIIQQAFHSDNAQTIYILINSSNEVFSNPHYYYKYVEGVLKYKSSQIIEVLMKNIKFRKCYMENQLL
jgi:hypothetical protein